MMCDKPWLANYDPDVPASLRPYPDVTLIDVLQDSARQRPSHPAICFQGRRITYQAWLDQSSAFAAALVALDLPPGERIALLLPNCPQLLICQIGAWQAGLVVTPLNPLDTKQELAHCLQETGATTAVVLTPFYHALKAIQPQTALRRIVACRIKSCLPALKKWLFTLFREKQEGHRIDLAPEDCWLEELLGQYAGHNPPLERASPDDPALLMFTGGTTGRPKAALSTHRALAITGRQIYSWMGSLKSDWEDVTLLLMPLFHTYGNVGVLSAAITGRNTLVPVPDPRNLDDVVQTIHRSRPAYLCGVPTLFNALLNHPAVQDGRVDFSSIKLCISGAAPLLEETRRRFEAVTGGRLIEGYALTESVMAAVMTPIGRAAPAGAIGLPLPDVAVCIVDADKSQSRLPVREVGQILLRAPQLMAGYWQQPEATAATLVDGWLHTGDLGYLDEEGFLYLVDRQKDVIKPSGFQVWPREVEEVIASHPAVLEVGVAGVPDEHQGEAVKAWVVLNPDQSLTAGELQAYCRQHLTGYKIPRAVVFCSDLPKSTIGKVLRRELTRL